MKLIGTFLALCMTTSQAFAGGTVLVQQPFLYYSYDVAAAAYTQTPEQTAKELDALENRIADKVVQRLSALFPGALKADAVSPVKQNCAKCHSGKDVKGNFSIDAELAPDQKLKMIHRVTLDPEDPLHMPPGKVLEPEALGELIHYLSKGQK